MDIAICITTLNEEGSVAPLLDSLLAQTKKPDEIVIVDGGSTDRTIEIISHYQKKDGRIRLLKEKCSRARGRNLGIEIARNEIIAVTDAGCIADKDWLQRLTEPFKINEEVDPHYQKFGVGVDVSAGFYKMAGDTPMQKAMGVFLGTSARKFDVNFLPSTRSIAFRKSAWEMIGGFPGEEKNSAEDTYFNFHALKLGMRYARVKDAVVEWGMPGSIRGFFEKIRSYAEWDARTKIWIFPGKGLTSHNIKALSVLLRYVAGVIMLALSFKYYPLFPTTIILFLVYLVWAYRKVYLEFRKWKAAIWGPVLQITSDFGVIIGFTNGLF